MDNIPIIKTIETWEAFKEYINTANVYKTEKSEVPEYEPIIYDWKENGFSLYRGHSNKNYRLQSTLERQIGKVSRKDFDDIQAQFLTECIKTFRGRIPDQFILTSEEYKNEVWAVGQHFGLKTPLLDWSKSFWVALFFAFEPYKTESDYRVVYTLNRFMAEELFPIISSRVDIGGRLYAQKGVFTNLLADEIEEKNKQWEREHAEAISNYGINLPITKILISSSLRNDILEFLYSININGSTLFPDIEGVIKDCHIGLDGIIAIHNMV